MKKFEVLIGLIMLLFAIGFNLWLYRLEPTALVDPNDNAFQFALVDRTNTIWDFAVKKCSSNILTFPLCHFSYLADHWVPNWAEGYNLPYYYSHIPQIVIVGSWRLLRPVLSLLPTMNYERLTLFQYYHWVIYLLLCFFPLSVFIALRVMRLPWWVAGIGAILATHVSTDGFYGLDPSSFLWRGYGLSSQLFAMTWLPLALAYSWRYLIQSTNEKTRHYFSFRILNSTVVLDFGIWNLDLLPATLFLILTTAGHLGIGMISLLSIVPLAVAQPIFLLFNQRPLGEIVQAAVKGIFRLVLLGATTVFFLSYWIVPTFLHDKFHNISFWDPVWKFNSYGWKETMTRLFNGDLFDFGRAPLFTLLILIGVIVCLISQFTMNDKRSTNDKKGLYPFSFLFIFWLLMYFGRTTWGGLIDLIPGMKDFHLSRFIVGVHVSGMLLAPIGLMWLVTQIQKIIAFLFYRIIDVPRIKRESIRPMLTAIAACVAGVLLIPPIYQQTIRYNELNDRLILQANVNAKKVLQDTDALFATIHSLPPGRVFSGRGGSWGKKFEIAETPFFMHLSTYGVPTVLWLPETWSMNSDTEQYFSEDQAKDYDLYNIRYVAAPPDQKPESFWKLIDQGQTWKFYEVPTTGYFTVGTHAAIVASDKQSFANVVRLWIQSDYTKQGLFPELTFDKGFPRKWGLPNFKMVDGANYMTPDGSIHSLFNEPPKYMADAPKAKLIGKETSDTDMMFKTKVQADAGCTECLLILKQSYAPGWKATIDGLPVDTMNVFPFFVAVRIPDGTHEVVFSYQPGTLKIFLLVMTLLVTAFLLFSYLRRFRKSPM